MEQLTLDRIGIGHGTDKASVKRDEQGERLGHDYLRHYEFMFDRFRNDEIVLIELGVYRGDSLRMWAEYFLRAEIYGVDIDLRAEDHASDRIKIVIGDVTEKKLFDKLKKALDGRRPFIIVDDASHAWGDQRMSLEMFWPLLAPGGFYVVEDLECGSMGAYSIYPPNVQDSRSFFKYVQDLCFLLRWSPKRRAFLSKDREFNELPEFIRKMMLSIDSCHFVPGSVILRKNPLKPPREK